MKPKPGAYEVYPTPGADPKVIPRINGSYMLADDSGHVVSQAPPTPIAIALGAQIVRLFSIRLADLAAGRYQLTISAQDKDAGVNLTAQEGFVVEPVVAAAAVAP